VTGNSQFINLIGVHAHHTWMQQMARNATGETWGLLEQRRYALHDRDTKFCSVFRATLAAGGVKPIPLPARSPNLNAYARKMGAIGERGMLIETNLVRRNLAATRPDRFH
jgi:hypothetical protein